MEKTITSNPIFFISQRSENKKIVNAFLDFLLENTSLNEDSFDIYCTSHPKYHLPSGETVVDNTLKAAAKCTTFIAIISDDYIESNFCIAELGIGFAKKFNDKDFNFLVINLNDIERTEIPMLEGKTIDKFENLDKSIIENKIKLSVVSDENTFNGELNKLKSLADKREKIGIKKATNSITSFIKRNFHNNDRLDKLPAVIYVDRPVYNLINSNLSNDADSLIWTAYGCPLKVDNVNPSSNLTKYDYAFSQIKGYRRRLVIFEDKAELDYFEKDASPRKLAFVKSNKLENSNLFITTREKLVNYYNIFNPEKKICINGKNDICDDKLNDLFYEFAHIAKYNIILFSEFNNTNTENAEKKYPLYFINYNRETEENFTLPSIRESVILNKYIVRNFDDLIIDIYSNKEYPLPIKKI